MQRCPVFHQCLLSWSAGLLLHRHVWLHRDCWEMQPCSQPSCNAAQRSEPAAGWNTTQRCADTRSESRRPRGRAGTGCSAGPRGSPCSWATCGASCPRRGCRADTRAQREDRELKGCAAGPALMGCSQQQAGARPKAGAGQGAAAALQLLLVLPPRSRGSRNAALQHAQPRTALSPASAAAAAGSTAVSVPRGNAAQPPPAPRALCGA